MTKIHQVIIRNTPKKGLDIINTTLEKSQVRDLYQFIPREIPSIFDKVFLTKCSYHSGKINLLITFDDGVDQYGRKSIKVHSLIIDRSFYNAKSIQYFISPLINGIMNVDEDKILKKSDFNTLNPHPVSSKFVELIYCKKHVRISTQELLDPQDIIQIFCTIDRIIPPSLTHLFSFQTMASVSHEKDLKKASLIFFPQKITNTYLLEEIQQETSEFITVQNITDAFSDFELLRQLQQKLFINIQERLLKLRIHLRFGIKTVSSIKKSLEPEMQSNLNLEE